MTFEDSVVLPALKPGIAFAVVHTQPALPSLASPSWLQALAAVAEAALGPWQRSAVEATFLCKGHSFTQPSPKGTLQACAPPQVATTENLSFPFSF